MARLDGKAVLITGAASRIGRATAALLAGEGATVALAEFNETRRHDAAQAMEGAIFNRLDVTNEADWGRVTKAIIKSLERLDGWATEPDFCWRLASRKHLWKTGVTSWRSISMARFSAASTSSAR